MTTLLDEITGQIKRFILCTMETASGNDKELETVGEKHRADN